MLKNAYSEFIQRIERTPSVKGAKTELIIDQIKKLPDGFSLSMLHEKCREASRDMVRKVMKDLQKEGKIRSKGRGAGARWYKKGNTLK